MDTQDYEDSYSIASLEDSESEEETKPKAKVKKTKESKGENDVLVSKKTGKPKRVMSEAQKENLAKARVLGRARRKELKDLRDQEKAIKKDNFLIRKLEVEKQVLEHKKKMRALAEGAGYLEKEPKIRGKYKERSTELKDDDNDKFQQTEIEKLEAQLATLRSSKTRPSKNRAPVSESESETEPEPEPEPEPVKVKKSKEKRNEPPEVKIPSNHKPQIVPSPMDNLKQKETVDPQLQAMLRSLFPNSK